MRVQISRLKTELDSRPFLSLGLAVLFAVVGQAFLIQQGHPMYLMIGGLSDLGAVLFFIQMSKTGAFAEKPYRLSKGIEGFYFLAVFVEAALFRLIKLGQIPAGLNSDTGCDGWGALRILHEGWRPFMKDPTNYFIFPAPYYELAFWFHFLTPNEYHILLFYSLVSLLAIPLIYWFFRQVAGVSTALLTIAFMAPMRWDIIFARMAHHTGDVHWFMFGCLAFGFYALESGKKWAWIVATLFLSAGFYTYDSFKPLLLLVVLILIYEAGTRSSEIVRAIPVLKICLFLFLVLSGPMWIDLFTRGGFGNPVDHLSLLETVRKDHHWLSLLENPIRTALMFNHKGSDWAQLNLPGHRMLDDATGILLVLGFGLALSRWAERKYFYGLAGAVVMCLPATLSINPEHPARTFGAIPFVAFLAAVALVEAGRILAQSKRALTRSGRWTLLALVLGWAAFQNGRTYFVDMANYPDFEWANALKETEVAKAIREDAGRNDYYLTPYFYNNFTVRFLDYFQADRTHLLPWPGGPWPPAPSSGRGAWFVLDRAQTGLLQFIQELYPGGKVRVFLDQAGIVRAYLYSAPAKDLGPGRVLAEKYRAAGQGLLGKYQAVTGPYTQVDPVLNFALRSDFPVTVVPPFQVQWTGRLVVKDPGLYQFIILTTDEGRLVLDGKTLLSSGNRQSTEINLRAGKHSLLVDYVKVQGGIARFHLLWKKPGDARYQVVPALALKMPFKAKVR